MALIRQRDACFSGTPIRRDDPRSWRSVLTLMTLPRWTASPSTQRSELPESMRVLPVATSCGWLDDMGLLRCHAGEVAEAERLLRALRTVATPAKDTVRLQGFADLAGRLPVGATDVVFRSVATVYRDNLSDDVIDEVLDRLADAPPATVLGLTHYMHGEVCRVAPDATAFPLRQPGGFLFRVNLEGNDSAAPRLMRWADDACGLLRPSSGEQIYVNYQSHTGKGSPHAVFGSNLPRLTALKNRYDPTNCFRRNSNVEPRTL